MSFARGSGILLHPTSLPGQFGIGDFGEEAFRFVDFLAQADQAYWQVLPLGQTGYGDSPYQCFSAWAGNTLLISPEKLVADGLITVEELEDRPVFPECKVDFGAVFEWKGQLLLNAYSEFNKIRSGGLRDDFEVFCHERKWWLDDYALYRAVKIDQGQKPWFEWPESLRSRDEEALRSASEQFSAEIQAEKFSQFLFFRQWLDLKEHANDSGIKIIGDIPIFVALDSVDVWCNQEKFKLNTDGTPKVVSGVPPDYFSKTGQLWGNPIFDWDAMRDDKFRWWTARVASALEIVDIIRIDHFRGFVASWEVPGTDKTAENGQWVDVPGKDLFAAMRQAVPKLPVIVEDLGFMTPEVEDLRDSFGFPGMRILQFGFGGDAQNRDLPHNYIQNCVAYTGTHDNDTGLGWFNREPEVSAESEGHEDNKSREHCLKYLDTDGTEIHWDLVRAVWASVADIAMAPLQDILGLGSEARMNLPASTSNNWQWRMPANSLTAEITSRLKDLTGLYGRSSR